MKPLLVVVGCAALAACIFPASAESPADSTLVPAASPGDEEQPQIEVEFEVYRVSGDISGDTSLTDNISPQVEGQEFGAKKGPFTFFTLAKLTIAGLEFRADEKGWTWNGKNRPSRDKKVALIASPKLRVLLDQPFQVAVGSEQPIEYFEKRPDGFFELKKLYLPTGLTVAAKIQQAESDRVVLSDLTIVLQSVEGRQPIEGVSLDVGQPTVKTSESKLSISVKVNRDYGILLRTEGYGTLLIRLRIGPAKRAT